MNVTRRRFIEQVGTGVGAVAVVGETLIIDAQQDRLSRVGSGQEPSEQGESVDRQGSVEAAAVNGILNPWQVKDILTESGSGQERPDIAKCQFNLIGLGTFGWPEDQRQIMSILSGFMTNAEPEKNVRALLLAYQLQLKLAPSVSLELGLVKIDEGDGKPPREFDNFGDFINYTLCTFGAISNPANPNAKKMKHLDYLLQKAWMKLFALDR